MALLEQEKLHSIYEEALKQGLQAQRETLLGGLNVAFLAMLQTNPAQGPQLLLDLTNLNKETEPVGGVLPLDHWLRRAALLSGSGTRRGRFFADMAELASRAAAAVGGQYGGVGGGNGIDDTLPERVIFRNDMLPVGFLVGALRTSKAVGRLIVPLVADGAVQMDPSSGAPLTGYATAWLVGPRHVMTNLHAIRAREQYEPVPTPADLNEQVARATIEFDYDSAGAAPQTLRVSQLVYSDAGLDYAVLELVDQSERQPLILRDAAIELVEGQPFPVNIIQHPGALPKHIALRNNLVAEIRGRDLAYYADTDGGSSGAPVCDDAWRVVALHREASRRFGHLNFQGKDTAWVNVGTPMALIVADLRQNAPDVWTAMAARTG